MEYLKTLVNTYKWHAGLFAVGVVSGHVGLLPYLLTQLLQLL